jgi:hypothetical protein
MTGNAILLRVGRGPKDGNALGMRRPFFLTTCIISMAAKSLILVQASAPSPDFWFKS